MTTHSFTVDDETLEEFLSNAENKSETIREALRVYRFQQEGVEDTRLSDRQRTAYAWLRETTGGDSGRTDLRVAKTVLAQLLSIQKPLVKHMVLKPLNRLGYIDVAPRMEGVTVVVRPPDAVDVPADVDEGETPADAGDRLSALAAAGEDAAEVAD